MEASWKFNNVRQSSTYVIWLFETVENSGIQELGLAVLKKILWNLRLGIQIICIKWFVMICSNLLSDSA